MDHATILARRKPRIHAVTEHWFDPCELLREDARSELEEELRERQEGGGWTMKKCGAEG